MASKTLIGPFSQILTLDQIPDSGPLRDENLQVVNDGGILIEGSQILRVLDEADWKSSLLSKQEDTEVFEVREPMVLMPGLIDSHTHICYAGSRAAEYAQRLGGASYLEILEQGGGILNTVRQTRASSEAELESLLTLRAQQQLQQGVTTCEVKSGYGLSAEAELKMLHVIQRVALQSESEVPCLISTCLAAHVLPPEFSNVRSYLEHVANDILPVVRSKNLSKRVDIFVEDNAFCPNEAVPFLESAKQQGFELTVHADQFSVGGSELAARFRALSADHLEVSTEKEIAMLKQAGVVANVLPGASLGLGLPFAPARKMLDEGLCVAIASDWNPGSAPMGDLLTQTALLSAYEKLSVAEALAGVTYRAAKALGLEDRGKLVSGKAADMIAFSCENFQDILYRQGALRPQIIWKHGTIISA